MMNSNFKNDNIWKNWNLGLFLIEFNFFFFFFGVPFTDWPKVAMASKQKSKLKKLGLSSSKAATPSSSTTSSSKQYLDTSIDGQSSPASSSTRSKPQYFYSESLPVEGERSKENVTVTVRFRPLRCISLFQTVFYW